MMLGDAVAKATRLGPLSALQSCFSPSETIGKGSELHMCCLHAPRRASDAWKRVWAHAACSDGHIAVRVALWHAYVRVPGRSDDAGRRHGSRMCAARR